MSHPAPNTSLSLSARLLCYIGPPSTILLTATASPQTALLSPISFLPTAWFYKIWQKANEADPSRRGELEPMIWTFAATGTLGLMTSAAIQLGVCAAANKILWGSGPTSKLFWEEFQRTTVDGVRADKLVQRALLASSWRTWVLNGIFSYLTAGLIEETVKYLPVLWARRRDTNKETKPRKRAYLDYVLAGALSFGLVECIGFIYTSAKHPNETWGVLAQNAFERIVIGQTGHLLVAALTALRAIRRDYYGDNLSWWGVVGPAALLHGTNDLAALSASALEGNVGWIHPTGFWMQIGLLGIVLGLNGIAASLVRWEWKALEERDRASKPSEDDKTR